MLSPSGTHVPAPFHAWLERVDGDGQIFLSVVTIHEIERGIVLLDRKGATAKAAGLRGWLLGLTARYSEKVLELDTNAATISGRLEADAIAQGHDPGMADAIIAGIAQAHGLTIVTHNTRHFLPFGVSVSSPDEVVSQSV
jgi:predicted nucleic acid-binding protein